MSSTSGYEAALARLEPKQQMFVREYLKDLSATQASIRAGYSKKGASVQGARLLATAKVADAVRLGMENRAAKVEVSSEFVLKGLLEIANVDIADAFTEKGDLKRIQDMPVGLRKSLAGVDIVESSQVLANGEREYEYTKKLKLCDRIRSFELLARHLGLLKDNLNITGHMRFANLSDEDLDAKLAAFES